MLPAVLGMALLLSGCGGEAAVSDGGAAASTETIRAGSAVTVQTIGTDSLFSDRDLEQSYDAAAAVTVRLTGATAQCDSDAVAIDGGRITLLEEGVYRFTGTLTDGQIVVDAGSGDKVQIVLDGADITSASSAALYCLEADKVFLTLAAGSENALSNGGTFTAVDDNNIDGAVFSKTDLTMNGTGSLAVTSPAGHGIVSKDELTVTGGTYTVTAARHGLAGKDSVAVAGGSFTISSGKDGIHAENDDDAAGGVLCVTDGSFVIDAQGDGVSAGGDLRIDGGSFALTAGGGSAAVPARTGNAMQRPGFRNFSDQPSAGTVEETESCKGIKADGSLTVNGGTFVLDTADDAVHGGRAVTITGGEWTIRTGDDGIHSDAGLMIQEGTFVISECYEGVEGQSVTIDGGTLDITARDDGINAAGGADGSGMTQGFGKQDRFAADGDCFITINGGEITVVSGGDSIDSNGSLTVNGGTLNLTCNGSGNTAIDTNGAYTNNGGSVTTNDGSESGGGMGGMGGKGGGAMNRGEKGDGEAMRPARQEREKPAA